MKNEIVIDGVTYIKKKEEEKKASKFKNIFETNSIQDLFEFSNENYSEFLKKNATLSERKLNLELIEKGIEILNQGWKPTMDNIWYYPYFKKTPKGFVFFCVNFDYCVSCVGSSLVLETEKLAKHATSILIKEYNLMMKP